MANPSTLYRFRIDLVDVDHGVYLKVDLRIPKHPSESDSFLITRVLAYALNYSDSLQFSKEGLGAPDDPCISIFDPSGGYTLWVEIGNPSPKKLHKATKSSKKVNVYTYKNPELLIQELIGSPIYQPERVELFSFSHNFLESLEELLTRDNDWNFIHQDGSIMIQIGDKSVQGEWISESLERIRKR